MEVTKAEIDAVLDAQGRFVWTPNALTLDGQRNIPCDLQPGESLLSFLRRHIDGVESGAWAVSIGGRTVPRAMWGKTFPKHGMHIACRASVGRQYVQLIAIAVLSYFTMGAGAGWIGATYGVSAGAAAAIGFGVFVAGSVLINKVLGPKVDKSAGSAAAEQVYSLRGQRNTARAYEPIGVLFGEMRVTPDLANQPYAWYAGDTQFLSTQLLGGVNVYSAHDLSNGDTALSAYSDTEVYFDGFPGMESQAVPLYSNADTLPGGELLSSENVSAGWVTRTTSPDTIRIEIDTEGMLHTVNSKGGSEMTTTRLTAEYAVHGSGDWQPLHAYNIFSNQPKTFRHTHGNDVAKGQYDVRVKVDAASRYEPGRSQLGVTWTSLRSVQPDATDYSQFGRIAIKMKATGQLSGSLDMLRANFRACPMPIWTGTEWVTATTRENGLSNPGAILLLTLRGIYRNGKLQFGYGLSDEQIDIEGLKAFMLYCTANGYTYDRWVTQSISRQDFCQEVALAGMGEFSWTDGSRPTAVFVANGQPVSAVVNMANMLKSSFSVDYALSNAADGIEYQYVDRTKDFETVTLRVTAPGVTTMLNPARVTGVGVTTEAHAARMARYHLAQSLYQYKTIGYTADIEHLDYRRLSVLSVSHDLTQWGFGGRVASAKRVGGQVHISLGEAVPVLTTPHLGLRLPGDRDYRVWPVQSFANGGETLVLAGQWPADVPLPGEDGPAHDTLWCYDFKATPGYKVRVVGLEPEGDLKGAKVTCVPEGPEFWNYVINGVYEPAGNQSSLPQLARPMAKNLRVSEEVHTQGNTEWYELHLVWDTTGDADYCQVWAGLDGSEPSLIDARATQNRASVRIDQGGEWLLRVVPFDAGGLAGTGANLLYSTDKVARPPSAPVDFVVQVVEGGLRRYAWQWGYRAPNTAGVQIRHKSGSSASIDDWGLMTPLGEADDIYTAAFESSRPDAGLWTFGVRAINTSGVLSPDMTAFTIDLPESLGEMAEIDLTPPPMPEDLQVEGLFATVQVMWGAPIYEMGKGHKTTEIWAAAEPVLGSAEKVAEGYAGPVSFEWELGSDVFVWARFVTNHDVPGPFAGPVTARTAEDIEQLLDILKGQFDKSHFVPIVVERLDTIDLIDKDGGPLGRSLIDAVAQQDSTAQRTRLELDDMAQGLIDAALAASQALGEVRDAGFYVDPATGQVKLYGLEVTKENVTNLEVLLDAMNGQIALKATTAYVDGRIAESVLSPADLILYEGLDARIISVAQGLNSVNGQLAQKASALELNGAIARLVTAESNLDALNGQINLRVTRLEYEADRDLIAQRMSNAEIALNSLDAPSIVATVSAVGRQGLDAEAAVEAMLRDLLSGHETRTRLDADIAFARTELNAQIVQGFSAEAQARTQLAAIVGAQGAALTQESSVRATQIAAEARARQALEVQMLQGDQQLQALVEQTAQTLAQADKVEASTRETVIAARERVQEQATELLIAELLQGHKDRTDRDIDIAFARTELNAQIVDGLRAEASQRLQLAAVMGANQALALQQTSALATALEAEVRQRNQLAAVVADNEAAIEQEQRVRAGVDGHLAAQYTLRMQLSQGGRTVVGGMAVTGTSNETAGATIDFGVLANRFFVAAPQGLGIDSNFQLTIQTVPTTVNGVTIPAGLYVDSAYLTNVSALWGRFGTLVADTIRATNISASRLTLGDGTVGGDLKSANFVPGSLGWRLRPNGAAEFSEVTVRGAVYATSGQIGGAVIGPASMRSSNYNGNPSAGWYLDSNGVFVAPHASVKTLTLSGNAVTVPVSVSQSTTTVGNGAWQTVISVTVPMDVAGVMFVSSGGYIGYPAGFDNVRIELLVDGSMVASAEGSTSLLTAALSGSLPVDAGTHTVSLRFLSSDKARVQQPSIFAMGVKR